jgi:hypothetical protein
MSKKQNTSNSSFKKKCQSASWDDLAIQIIQLESQLHSKNKLKTPKNIHKKLEILEEEKSRRVSDCFDIHYFLNKEYEVFEVEYDEDSST